MHWAGPVVLESGGGGGGGVASRLASTGTAASLGAVAESGWLVAASLGVGLDVSALASTVGWPVMSSSSSAVGAARAQAMSANPATTNPIPNHFGDFM